MEYNLARDEQRRVLNPHQSAYLLLDDGCGREDAGDCVQAFRTQFDNFLSGIKTIGSGTLTAVYDDDYRLDNFVRQSQ